MHSRKAKTKKRKQTGNKQRHIYIIQTIKSGADTKIFARGLFAQDFVHCAFPHIYSISCNWFQVTVPHAMLLLLTRKYNATFSKDVELHSHEFDTLLHTLYKLRGKLVNMNRPSQFLFTTSLCLSTS